MDKTRVDDINTLLLKSQYNHINHLYDKLNETVEAVKNLEFKFSKLEDKVSSDIKNLEINLEASIQKALNKNMLALIGIIGFFFTLMKIIDLFKG